MSAAEDYPRIAWMETFDEVDGVECRHALAEIDMLRADVAKLLSMCAAAGLEWPTR